MLMFWLFVITFLASLLGVLCGTFLFIKYCQKKIPDFYNQLVREAQRKQAPMKDRRTAETTNPNPQPTPVNDEKHIESFMSAIANSQDQGSTMLYATNQHNYGWDKTIEELCASTNYTSPTISENEPEKDVYAVFDEGSDGDTDEDLTAAEESVVYPDEPETQTEEKLSEEPEPEPVSVEKPKTKNKPEAIQFAVAPDAIKRTEDVTPPKRKRGRPPKKKPDSSK